MELDGGCVAGIIPAMGTASNRRPASGIPARTGLICSLAAIAGCASEYGGTPRGVSTDLVILEQGFVAMDGVRMPLEGFLLEMRRRARAAGEDLDAKPMVHIRLAEGHEDGPGVLNRIVKELNEAGIVYISIG